VNTAGVEVVGLETLCGTVMYPVEDGLAGEPGLPGTVTEAESAGPEGMVTEADPAGPEGIVTEAESAGPEGIVTEAEPAGPEGIVTEAEPAGPEGMVTEAEPAGPEGTPRAELTEADGVKLLTGVIIEVLKEELGQDPG
jgi:hypothetical protein